MGAIFFHSNWLPFSRSPIGSLWPPFWATSSLSGKRQPEVGLGQLPADFRVELAPVLRASSSALSWSAGQPAADSIMDQRLVLEGGARWKRGAECAPEGSSSHRALA